MIQLLPTALPDVVVLEPDVFRDARGFFLEAWHEEKFRDVGLAVRFVQDNHSHSVRHTLRGLHYQLVRPQGKLVRVTSGTVFDVAVDLRRDAPTFGRWVGVTLSEENHRMVWIPPGFAHGFLVLSQYADLLYKCSEPYLAEHDRAIRWNDPALGIEWPLAAETEPLLSPRDASAPLLAEVVALP
jgi:dTDP-4-dehydrorhamnose 3,5-epimerase